MPDYEKYRKRLEDKIGEAMAAAKIFEASWWDVVVKDLNLMSYYFAHDIGVETKTSIDKGAYTLSFEEWTHGRLIALNLILSYWLGFQSLITSYLLYTIFQW